MFCSNSQLNCLSIFNQTTERADTHSFRSRSVTSEYAGFRTFIVILRILWSYSATKQKSQFRRASINLTRRRVGKARNEGLCSSSPRSAWEAQRGMPCHNGLD